MATLSTRSSEKLERRAKKCQPSPKPSALDLAIEQALSAVPADRAKQNPIAGPWLDDEAVRDAAKTLADSIHFPTHGRRRVPICLPSEALPILP